MSIHAVHAGAERNVCNIVVSTETPQTTTNPSQTLLPVYKLAHLPLSHPKSSPPRPPQPLAQPFAQMCYRCENKVSSTGPNILEVYIIYLHVYMCHTPLFGFSVTMPLSRKVQDVTKEQIYAYTISW